MAITSLGATTLVEFLYVYRQTLNALPKNIDRFFPNLIAIVIVNSYFITITAEDLQPFLKLLYFVSHTNPLVSLDGDLFKHTRKLKFIRMNNSQLQHVGNDLLSGLSDLEYSDFRKNPCINVEANTSTIYSSVEKRDFN